MSQSSQNSHILLPLELIVHTDMHVGTRSDRYVDIISECSLVLLSVDPSSNIHIGMHNQCGWSGKRTLRLLRDILAMVAAVLKLRLQIRISLSECDSTSFSTRPSPLIFRGYPLSTPHQGGGGPEIGKFCGQTVLAMRMKGEWGCAWFGELKFCKVN